MKQRKPILALLVAAALLPWLTVSARAADTDVMFSDPSVVVGNTVTVNVYTTSAVAGIDLTLVYDTDYLTYTGASGGLGNAAVQDNGGSLHIVDYSGSGEGKFSLNLSFTARAIGTTALRPTACSASNAGGDAVSVEYASHSGDDHVGIERLHALRTLHRSRHALSGIFRQCDELRRDGAVRNDVARRERREERRFGHHRRERERLALRRAELCDRDRHRRERRAEGLYARRHAAGAGHRRAADKRQPCRYD